MAEVVSDVDVIQLSSTMVEEFAASFEYSKLVLDGSISPAITEGEDRGVTHLPYQNDSVSNRVFTLNTSCYIHCFRTLQIRSVFTGKFYFHFDKYTRWSDIIHGSIWFKLRYWWNEVLPGCVPGEEGLQRESCKC